MDLVYFVPGIRKLAKMPVYVVPKLYNVYIFASVLLTEIKRVVGRTHH